MFGYVTINKPELKIREFDMYRSYYCGLCQSLRKRHGLFGQLTLSYDMTFLAMLLNSLYEPSVKENDIRCIVHPINKQHVSQSVYTDYVADMNLLLSYYKCLDDWNDEKNILKLSLSKLLKTNPSKQKPLQFDEKDLALPFIDYSKKAKKIQAALLFLSEKEKAGVTDIDTMAGIFGDITSTIFTPHHDQWEPALSKMGFYLGKFIYIMDAYDDIESDVKKGCYNPFKDIFHEPDFDDQVISMLQLMMADCSNTFELLPIIDNVEILRNILYAGVWQNRALHNKERKKDV